MQSLVSCLNTKMSADVEEVMYAEEASEHGAEEPPTEEEQVVAEPSSLASPLFKPVNPLVVSKRWKEYVDPVSNRPFFFDRITKGVQWRKPVGFLSRKELLRPVSANRIGSSDWKVVSTLGGRDYFWNMETGVVAWLLPEDFNTPLPVSALSLDITAASAPVSDHALDKKRLAVDSLEQEAPEAKRRKLASESLKPATLVGMFEDTRDIAVQNYKRMLEAVGVDKDADWSDWMPRLAKESRFNAVVSLVERRSLFEAYVRQLASEYKAREKKRREEAKEALRKEIQKLPANSWRGFDAFKDLLRPTEAYQHLRDLDPESIGDLYDEANRLEAEARRKERERAKRDFLDLLEEKIRDQYERDTRKDWLDFKLLVEEDPRYNRAQLSGADRENLFEDFAAEVCRSLRSGSRPHAAKSSDLDVPKREFEGGRESSEAKRREDAIRRRNEEALRQRHREEIYARDKHDRMREERELSNFRTLLAERVTRAQTEWEDVQDSLSRDDRFDTQYIDSRGKRRLFEEHVKQLRRSAETKFCEGLDRFGAGDCYLSWQEACDSLVATPVFNILNTNTDREAAYDVWAKQKRAQLEADLRSLFQATKIITKDTELDNPKERNPILDKLRKDARWRSLPDSSEGWEKRRMALLRIYVDSLNNSPQQ